MAVFHDWGTAILSALANALTLFLTFIPRLIGFLVIMAIGWLIAFLISKGITLLLRKLHFDQVADRIGLTRFDERMGVHTDPAGILGKIVFWFLILVFLVPATDALGLPAVSNVLNQLVAYIPNVFVAIIVLFLGTLLATIVADLVRGATASANVGNPNLFATIARYAVIGFAALIALEQLQIAPSLLNILFTAIVGGAALAFALAFGLGGRDAAQRLLARTENSVSNAPAQVSARQRMEQEATTAQMQTNQQMQADQMRTSRPEAY